MKQLILIISSTTTALMAGLFFAWSCSVVPGLLKLPHIEYLNAMQSFNRAIQNPVFLTCFLGTPLLLPLCAYLYYSPDSLRFWMLAAAAAVYIAGVFGVTMLGNIPLNESLERFAVDSASLEEIAAERLRFEKPWNNLNLIRTIAAIASLVLTIVACIDPGSRG